jgi:hypothetical protein
VTIADVLTRAEAHTLKADDILQILYNSQGNAGAGFAKSHVLEHTFGTARDDQYAFRARHSEFTSAPEMAEVIAILLQTGYGIYALKQLSTAATKVVEIITRGGEGLPVYSREDNSQGITHGSGETADLFAERSVVKAKTVVIILHDKGGDLHVQSCYPRADDPTGGKEAIVNNKHKNTILATKVFTSGV